jgi:hypothetical protein
VWILFLLAVVNGPYLYFAPGQADTGYAWSIKPPVSAAFLGGGYIAGVVATGLVLFVATRWRSFRTLPPALWVLSMALLLATAIHADRFKFGFPPTWIWTLLYAGMPLVVPVLVLMQERNAEPEPPADARLRLVRWLSAIFGAVMLIGAVALFIAPVDLGEHWPWMLTPLLARVVSAWYAMVGTMLLACWLGLRRPSEAIIPYATLAAWCVLLLLLPFLHPDEVQRSGGEFVAYMAFMAALLALAVLALATASTSRSAAAEADGRSLAGI